MTDKARSRNRSGARAAPAGEDRASCHSCESLFLTCSGSRSPRATSCCKETIPFVVSPSASLRTGLSNHERDGRPSTGSGRTVRKAHCQDNDADGVEATRWVAPADRLPDYVDYSDDGCSLFPSCLECPLTRCRYDEQPGGRRAATRLRDRDLMRERRLGGKSAADLARSFGVSKRTVQRIIRRASSE